MPHNQRHDQSTTPPRSRKGLFSDIGGDFFAALLELVGTVLFLLLGLGAIQASSAETAGTTASNVERVLFISTCMGFSLLVSAWIFFRVTGALFNPNVALALLLVGAIRPVRFVLYCIAQMIGAIVAAALVLALTPGPLASNTFLQQGINPAQGVFIEMFTTAGLALAVLMLAAEKHQATPFAPIGIGLTLFAGHMFAVYYTGAGMNTARSFGPAVVTGFPYHNHWVYWLGPFLGSLLAALFYSVLKHYHYWQLNPGQDEQEKAQSPGDPIQRFFSRNGGRDDSDNRRADENMA